MNNNLDNPDMQAFTKKDFTVHKKKNSYKGFFQLNEYQLSHKLFRGGESEVMSREIFERGNAVVLMPYDAKNDVVILQEQFRPGAIKSQSTPWMLEFVAGMFNENESPIEVAIREAKEEANIELTQDNITEIMTYYPSPGGCNELIYLYLGLIDSKSVGGIYGLPEEHEDILVHAVPRADAMKLLEQGKINNAATIIGLQWLQSNYQRLQG